MVKQVGKWTEMRAADFIEFNPRMSIKKGTIATKVAMDKLQPFTKKIPDTEKAPFSGGSKFRNGDTIMARITPCLENGKTAFVDILGEDEIAFGSTELNTPPETVPLDRTNGAPRPLKWCMVTAAMVH